MSRPFLTAKWQNLFLATYAVEPALLEKRVPSGLTLDMREGKAFVSLVAFEFMETRVFGIGWPGYRNFAELNLRFYVRHGEERGVVFIREFVPQRFVAWMARWLYNEPYLAAPITAVRQENADSIQMHYQLTYGGKQHSVQVTGGKPSYQPAEDTLEHFFKEEHWGFGVLSNGQPIRYWVEHPIWNVYPVKQFQLQFDFGTVYGPEFAFLAGQTPYATALAVGSEISVSPKGNLPTK